MNGIYGHCFRDRCGFAESDVRTKKYEEVGEVRDLPGNIFEWLGRNYDKITPEQREKIFMDLEKKQE